MCVATVSISGNITRAHVRARVILQLTSITTGRGGYERRKDVYPTLVARVDYCSISDGIHWFGSTSHNRRHIVGNRVSIDNVLRLCEKTSRRVLIVHRHT